MHLKAIEIKENVLSSTDLEVGLSVGHLAALYCFDLRRFRDAEPLYLRSITISMDLFGPSYSGLEYDYRFDCMLVGFTKSFSSRNALFQRPN
jgi:hypothetical protein